MQAARYPMRQTSFVCCFRFHLRKIVPRSKARDRVATALLVNYCPSSPFIAWKESYFAHLFLHLIIRVDKVVVLILIIVIPKLLISLSEVDGLSACARAVNDVRGLDLFHIILVGLLSCSR